MSKGFSHSEIQSLYIKYTCCKLSFRVLAVKRECLSALISIFTNASRRCNVTETEGLYEFYKMCNHAPTEEVSAGASSDFRKTRAPWRQQKRPCRKKFTISFRMAWNIVLLSVLTGSAWK